MKIMKLIFAIGLLASAYCVIFKCASGESESVELAQSGSIPLKNTVGPLLPNNNCQSGVVGWYKIDDKKHHCGWYGSKEHRPGGSPGFEPLNDAGELKKEDGTQFICYDEAGKKMSKFDPNNYNPEWWSAAKIESSTKSGFPGVYPKWAESCGPKPKDYKTHILN
jgi:hypothetical protein